MAIETVEPSEPILAHTAVGGIHIQLQYPKQVATLLGTDFMPEVAGAETPKSEVMSPENKEEFKVAKEKEIDSMRQRRFVRKGDKEANSKQFIPADQLTPEQKKKALKCRLVYNIKRPEGKACQKGQEESQTSSQEFR